MLYDSMTIITDNTLDDTFVTRLFVTQPDKEERRDKKDDKKDDKKEDRKEKLPLDSEVIPVAKAKKRIPFNKGRPNIEKEFSEIATIHAASIKRHAILAFVCGPAPLVSSIALETYKHNFMYHSETFEL